MHQDEALNALQSLNIQLNKVKTEINIPNDETFNQLQQLIVDFSEKKEYAILDCQQWLGHIFNFYPQLAPLVPRALLWFAGGECLHYLTDDELQHFEEVSE